MWWELEPQARFEREALYSATYTVGRPTNHWAKGLWYHKLNMYSNDV